MRKKVKTSLVAEFRIDDKVRVRRGVTDNEYPDMPMGGWAGTISQTHNDGTYLVRWTDETLAAIHSVYANRCENDGLDYRLYPVAGSDLEPDVGGPLDIEQPKQITSRPLSPKDQDDRIRKVFGLTSNDTVPDVDSATLATYYGYLSTHLTFPFAARYGDEYGCPEQVNVIGLCEPDETMIDDMYGILCEVRTGLGVESVPMGELDQVKPRPHRQLIADYCYWLHNWL